MKLGNLGRQYGDAMKFNNPYENPYDEDEFLNPDCDCYGCATMRHACQYEKRREKNRETQDTFNEG